MRSGFSWVSTRSSVSRNPKTALVAAPLDVNSGFLTNAKCARYASAIPSRRNRREGPLVSAFGTRRRYSRASAPSLLPPARARRRARAESRRGRPPAAGGAPRAPRGVPDQGPREAVRLPPRAGDARAVVLLRRGEDRDDVVRGGRARARRARGRHDGHDRRGAREPP